MQGAIGALAAIHHRQGSGVEFSGNPNNGRHPHPEHRAGATNTDSNSHTGYITQTNSARECRGQGLSMGNASGIIGVIQLAPEQVNGMAKISVGTKAGVEHKEQAATHQQYH